MDDPWNERKRPHPMIYCFVIVICAAPLIVYFVSAILGMTP